MRGTPNALFAKKVGYILPAVGNLVVMSVEDYSREGMGSRPLLSYSELSPAGEGVRRSRGPACVAMVQIICLIRHGVRPMERRHRFDRINSTELGPARIDKFTSVTQGRQFAGAPGACGLGNEARSAGRKSLGCLWQYAHQWKRPERRASPAA